MRIPLEKDINRNMARSSEDVVDIFEYRVIEDSFLCGYGCVILPRTVVCQRIDYAIEVIRNAGAYIVKKERGLIHCIFPPLNGGNHPKDGIHSDSTDIRTICIWIYALTSEDRTASWASKITWPSPCEEELYLIEIKCLESSIPVRLSNMFQMLETIIFVRQEMSPVHSHTDMSISELEELELTPSELDEINMQIQGIRDDLVRDVNIVLSLCTVLYLLMSQLSKNLTSLSQVIELILCRLDDDMFHLIELPVVLAVLDQSLRHDISLSDTLREKIVKWIQTVNDVPVMWRVVIEDDCGVHPVGKSDRDECFGSCLKSVTDDMECKVLKHHYRLMALQTLVYVLGQTEHTGDLESMIEERGRVWY